MARALKVLGILVGVFLALLAALVATINLLPGEHQKALIASVVHSATGREIGIGGEIDLAIASHFTFSAADVHFANAHWGTRPEMFSSARIQGDLALLPLLAGVVDFSLVAEAPDLWLETDAQGLGNWRFGTPEAAIQPADDQGGGIQVRPVIREFRLQGAKFAYLDGLSGEQANGEFATILLESRGDEVAIDIDGQVQDIPIRISGGVNHQGDTTADQPARFRLQGGAGEIQLTADGRLSALATDADMDLALNLEAPSLAALGRLAGRALPPYGPLRAEMEIEGAGGALALKHIRASLDDERLALSAEGAVSDLARMSGISGDLDLRTERLDKVLTQLQPDLRLALPAKTHFQARLEGRLEQLQVPRFQASLDQQGLQAELSGSVGDLGALTALKADAEFRLASLAALNPLLGQDLPASGPLTVNASLRSDRGLAEPSELTASLSADGVAASAEGSTANLLDWKGIAARLELRADTMRQLAKLSGHTWDDDDPLALQAEIEASPEGPLSAAVQGTLQTTDISGQLRFTPTGGDRSRPQLAGNLHLGKIDLSPFLDVEAKDVEIIGPDATEQSALEAVAETTGSDRVFSSDPLPFELLQLVDADLELKFDEILTEYSLLERVAANLSLHNGRLSMEPVTATVDTGAFSGRLVVDTEAKPTRITLVAKIDKGTFRNFGGTNNLNIDLRGSGNSIAEIMAGLDGQVIIDVRDLDLKKSFLTEFGQGLFNSLDPFEAGGKTSHLACAVMRFDIEDGIANADDKLVAQLTKVTWFGGGQVDLKTEQLELGAQSKPRKGLGLQVLGQLSSLMQVRGTLAHPVILLDPKGVVKTYGEYYLTVASGGLYLLLKSQWDKSDANADLCAQILAMEQSDRAAKPGAKKGAAPAPTTERPVFWEH